LTSAMTDTFGDRAACRGSKPAQLQQPAEAFLKPNAVSSFQR
jgi:hypothetical protein